MPHYPSEAQRQVFSSGNCCEPMQSQTHKVWQEAGNSAMLEQDDRSLDKLCGQVSGHNHQCKVILLSARRKLTTTHLPRCWKSKMAAGALWRKKACINEEQGTEVESETAAMLQDQNEKLPLDPLRQSNEPNSHVKTKSKLLVVALASQCKTF